VYCVSAFDRFAQSLREPLSPRSSERFLSKLTKVVLRVNATEVKKKFPATGIEIDDAGKKNNCMRKHFQSDSRFLSHRDES
jgi:hypothetical protein